MRAVVSRIALVTVALAAACGDPPAHVHLVPIDLGTCGKPSAAEVTSLKVIAYAASVERPRTVPLAAAGAVDISDFPADTEQLGIELSSASGVVAAGKTAPLDYAALPDGAQVPIAVVPLGGFCRVGDLVEARAAPLVARTTGGVLVVGGHDQTGVPIASAEVYDETTATFAPVTMPPELHDVADFAGGVLTTLADGRVALTGTASHVVAIFDPKTRAFGVPTLLDPRAFHGAYATATDRLFVIGGCGAVTAGSCSGPPLHSSLTYHLDDLRLRESGPQLPDTARRTGATVFDLGVQTDGVHRYALAGGDGDPGAADRFALSDTATTTVGGLDAQVAPLDGGALLSAFAPDGMAASGAASQLAPDGAAAAAVASAPPVAGARLVALEDGSVLAVGGDPGGDVARYVPTANAWQAGAPSTEANAAAIGALAAPSLARLDDGTVLVLGGAAASSSAWIYRPSLIGPSSGLVVVEPGNADGGVLTALDAATASHGGGTFSLAGDPAFALVGGARTATGSVNAAVKVTGTSLQLVAQAQGPGRALVGVLAAGSRATIGRVDGGAMKILCTGQLVPDFDPTASTAVGLAVSGGSATLSLAAVPLATCSLASDLDASDRGAWGIAALAGTRLDIATITVSR